MPEASEASISRFFSGLLDAVSGSHPPHLLCSESDRIAAPPRIAAMGPKPDSGSEQKGFLFDDLVSPQLELQRHVEAERIGCL